MEIDSRPDHQCIEQVVWDAFSIFVRRLESLSFEEGDSIWFAVDSVGRSHYYDSEDGNFYENGSEEPMRAGIRKIVMDYNEPQIETQALTHHSLFSKLRLFWKERCVGYVYYRFKR